MSSQEIERRVGAEPAQVRAVPVPAPLQEIGVRIGKDETGMAVVFLPPALRQVANVVNPTSSYVQADPNWTPGISMVTIDVERDTYNVAGKRGLGKQALETLAKAAGVLYTRTTRVPRAELQPGERWAYRATVGFRRSDGTIDEITRERGFNEEAEMEEIKTSVETGSRTKDWSREKQDAEIRKRWLAELKFGPAKTESKAINRALRAGLSIPTSLSPADAAKPFIVVGYNFTPNYDDPETRRALVAVAMNAQAAIYGGRDVSEELPELAAGDLPAEALGDLHAPEVAETASPPDSPSSGEAEDGGSSSASDPSADDATGGEPEPPEEQEAPADVAEGLTGDGTPADPDGQGTGDTEQAGGDASDSAPANAEPEPGTEASSAGSSEDEPEPGEEPQTLLTEAGPAEENLGATEVPNGFRHTGKTLAELCKDPNGQTWLIWALRNPRKFAATPDFYLALETYMQAEQADVWNAVRGEES